MKKLISMLLVMAIAFSLFAGCGTKEETPDTPAENTEKTETSKDGTDSEKKETDDASAETVTAPEEITYPLAIELAELKIMVPTDSMIEDLETNELTAEYEAKTNVHVAWEEVPSKSKTEKLNIVLATGEDMPDILLNMGLSNQQIITYGVDQEILIDLKPLIDQYAPNIRATLDAHPEYENAITAPNGSIYALPEIDEVYHVKGYQKYWIYQPWLDAVGMEVPTTIDELTAVLRAFKEQDPNGNGEQDEIPLTGAITGWNTGVVDFFMSAFVYSDQGNRWVVNNGEVSVPYNTNEWREGLKYLNMLYSEGLLDPSAFTQDQPQLKQVVMNEAAALVGSATGGAPGAISKNNSERAKGFVVVPPLTGPEGYTVAAKKPLGIQPGKFAITSVCEDPVLAIKWLDWFYSQEGSLRSRAGVEGRDWRYAEGDEKGVNDLPGVYFRLLKFGKVQNAHWNKIVPIYFSDALRNGLVVDDTTLEKYLYDITKEHYEPHFPEEVMKPFFMTVEEAEEYAEYNYLVESFVEESNAKFILGSSDINDDAEWEKYLAELNNMGLERYIEIAQNGYTAQYK